jgi:hypothetical protein
MKKLHLFYWLKQKEWCADDGVCRRIVLKNKKRKEFGRERVNLEGVRKRTVKGRKR